ncbi:MAG: M23 family metallopeptidase [Candidatus Electrothrix sp. YB6]
MMRPRNKRRLGSSTSSTRSSAGKSLGRKFAWTVLLLIIAFAAVAGFILFENGKPQLTLDKELRFLGGPVEIQLHAVDTQSGIRNISVTLEQNGKEHQLFSRQYPRQAWLTQAGPDNVSETVMLNIQEVKEIQEGPAQLTVTASDFSLNRKLLGNAATLSSQVTIDTKPPKVLIEHAQLSIASGGSGIVVYSVSEPSSHHGVMIDDIFFQGFPLKGSDSRRIAYIALPWNSERPESTRVVAVDQAGNEGNAAFSIYYKKAKEKKDRINVSDGFLKKKIPEFEDSYPELAGTDLEKYLFVNSTIRQRNAQKIAELCSRTAEEQLWHDRFLRMPGAGKAGFADQRTYYYQGEPIDHQTHLGIDLASTARVEIEAANRGEVVFADYLGIYGNTVILDHGQGLASLYSHLSRISTEKGRMVEKGEQVGNSGATGMAGGDHLHFSMLVHGIFVTPVEWWDQHWIDVNINNNNINE